MTRAARTTAVLSLSIAFASVAAYGMYRVVGSIAVREVEVTSYQVVVTTAPLATGVLLQASDVKLVPWPAAAPVAGAFTDIKTVINRGLLTPLLANEPITADRLAPVSAGGGLTPSIRSGMRAMSVKVNEVIGVAGFVVPGTRVDVLVTIRRGTDDTMTRTVVSNAQVLTAGTRNDQEKPEGAESIPSTVVTLVVTPADAERIALAQAEGQIMLALRNPLDTAVSDAPGIGTAALMGAQTVPAPVATTGVSRPPPPRPAAAAGPRPYSVEVIRGAKRSDEALP